MATAQIVEGLDPLERELTSMVVIGEVVAISVFESEGGEKSLRPGVIVAITPATPGGCDTMVRELFAKAFAGSKCRCECPLDGIVATRATKRWPVSWWRAAAG